MTVAGGAIRHISTFGRRGRRGTGGETAGRACGASHRDPSTRSTSTGRAATISAVAPTNRVATRNDRTDPCRVDVETALRAYDSQLRRSVAPPAPGWAVQRVEEPAPLIRLVSPPQSPWGDGVVWTVLDERSADAAIADTISYFAGLGRGFE